MDLIVYILMVVIGYPASTIGISTTHHDKPENSSISIMATKMAEDPKPELSNITLTPSERQKRLLSYTNFYQNQGYDSPPYQALPADKHRLIPKKVHYDDYQPNHDALYRPHDKYTPFLESNSLPGPFKPIITSPPTPARFEVQYVSLPQNKLPNYSAIYEKLAQLKLSQNYRRPTFAQIDRPVQPQIYAPKPQINYNRYKIIQPSKTTIETFTATNIDITSGPGNDQYQHVKNFGDNKPSGYGQKEHPGRKPFIIVQSPQNRPPKPLVFIQRKPVFRVKPKYIPHDLPKYIQFSPIKEQYDEPPEYVTTKYEQFPKYQDIMSYNEEVPSSMVNPVKYKEAPIYEDTKYKQYQEYSPPVRIPASHEDVPRQQENFKYNDYQDVLPQEEHSPKYEKIPKYQYEEYHSTKPPTKASQSLADLLRHLQAINTLPKTLTADNIDNSIKTPVRILDGLKKQQKFSKPIVVQENVSPDYNEDGSNEAEVGDAEELPYSVSQNFPEDTPEGGTPGKPGEDYPALSTIPLTSFNCKTQRYKGFFGDPDTNCQVWHYCDLNGGQSSFLCPNGTIFSQVALTCDWWYNVKCSSTAQLYVLNERLYKYIIPLSPKFPEDYSGPLVDKYLALKFREMEEKMKREKKGKGNASKEDESKDLQDIESEENDRVETHSPRSQLKETLETIEDDSDN